MPCVLDFLASVPDGAFPGGTNIARIVKDPDGVYRAKFVLQELNLPDLFVVPTAALVAPVACNRTPPVAPAQQA